MTKPSFWRLLYIGSAVPSPEKLLIAEIRRMASAARSRMRPKSRAGGMGIGDDCAVLRFPGPFSRKLDTLVTTDFSLEGIHFRREWHAPESVGHRCLARGLSDIAAMGGDPVAAFLSLAVPAELPQVWIRRFLTGLLALGKKYGITLSGGDTAESPDGILADIVVVGSVPRGKTLLRSGARPGDRIYVSGELGGSAAAVQEMMNHPKRKLSPRNYSRHFFPEPRIRLGRVLRERGIASAMIDVSDGLSTDLAHICEESGVGAEVEGEAIPRAGVGKAWQQVSLELALHGGEDYELLFTAPGAKRVPSHIGGVQLTEIGEIKRGGKIFLRNASGSRVEFKPRGWEHFRR